jgi:ABC-type phosphate transport system substrate-binding protein
VKINLTRAGLSVIAAVATAAGFAGTTLTGQAINVHGVDCPSAAGTVAANGSSLQNAGVQAELTSYNGTGSGCATPGTVGYTSTGSGTLITEADTNSSAVAFGGTDVPYTHQDFVTMNSTGWGRVQTIPLAESGVAYVTSTSNCAASANLSGATLGEIFAGKITDWHAVSAACAVGTTIHVGVRSSGCSGTTQAVKDYFNKKDSATYAQLLAADPATTGNPTKFFCDPFWGASTPWITCTGSTNQVLVNCTSDANLITYVDESDASTHVPTLSRHAIDNAAGTFSTWTSGACSTAAAAAVTPNTTAADWSGTDITNAATGYGDCTFTYQLASAGCVNLTAQGQACHGMTNAQAQVTRAFIEFEVTDAGQAIFAANNYDTLPNNLEVHSQAGAATL